MKMLLLLFTCFTFGSEVTLSFGGSGLEVVNQLEFQYNMGQLTIKSLPDALVSLEIPKLTTLSVKGEPDLPVLREFVALPHLGDWDIVIEDVEVVKHDLDGRRVIPSKGQLLLKQDPNDVPLVFGDLYSSPTKMPIVDLIEEHTMRDVTGTILEINPIFYDATNGMLEIVVSCNIKLVSSQKVDEVKESKVVDPDFYDLYKFHYINFDHYTDKFIKGDDLGRMIVFYDSKFKDSATEFATWKKNEKLKDVILAPCSGSADSLKSIIQTHFKETDSLTYVVLFGRSCPTFNCQVSRRECDVQYAQLTDDQTLDVFVSRIAADSQSDVDGQFNKFKEYSSSSVNLTVGDWQHQTAGLALDLIGDEYKYMHRNLDALTSFGFTKADYMQDNSASSTQVYKDWNAGMGVYIYIGHGSGTAWNCPQHTGGFPMSAINSKLTNKGMYPFVLECSCLNGGFKKQNPCFAAAMMAAANKGPISMYSSAPEAQSSSPKDLQSGAVDAITKKAATRVGPIYYAGIMYAYKLKPRQAKYTLQGYNMFGDPSIQLNFLRS